MKKITSVTVNDKTYTVDSIKKLILTRDDAVKRALLTLYNFQTSQEQVSQHTIENNNVGFSGADSEILSNISEFYKRTNYMSEKQINLCRKRLVKYSSQLLRIMSNQQ